MPNTAIATGWRSLRVFTKCSVGWLYHSFRVLNLTMLGSPGTISPTQSISSFGDLMSYVSTPTSKVVVTDSIWKGRDRRSCTETKKSCSTVRCTACVSASRAGGGGRGGGAGRRAAGGGGTRGGA